MNATSQYVYLRPGGPRKRINKLDDHDEDGEKRKNVLLGLRKRQLLMQFGLKKRGIGCKYRWVDPREAVYSYKLFMTA